MGVDRNAATVHPMSSATQTGSGFDAFRLSATGGVIEGRADAAQFPRLVDRLARRAPPSPIDWRIEGARDARGRPQLTVALKGSVWLDCQRCLQAFERPLEQATTVLLAHDEAELAQLDAEELEVVLAMSRLNALELVEEELVLTVPFAPHHPDDACSAERIPSSEARADSPFAALGRLKEVKRIETKE